MCGIAGAFGSMKIGCQSLNGQEQRAVAAMWRAAEVRGRDAAGVFGFDDQGRGGAIRRVGPAKALIGLNEERRGGPFGLPNPVTLVCHTRLASKGNRLNVKNAHPFHHGNVVGVHNGTVHNAHQLVPIDSRKKLLGETDSEAIILTMAMEAGERSLTKETVAGICGKLDGTFALVLADTRDADRLILAGSPMVLYRRKETGTVFFASTSEIMARGLAEAGIKVAPGNIEALPWSGDRGMVLAREVGGVVTMELFDIPTKRFGSYGWGDKTRVQKQCTQQRLFVLPGGGRGRVQW